MPWWNKLRGGGSGGGEPAADPADQIPYAPPKSHEELAEEAMAQLLAMSMIKPINKDAEAAAQAEEEAAKQGSTQGEQHHSNDLLAGNPQAGADGGVPGAAGRAPFTTNASSDYSAVGPQSPGQPSDTITTSTTTARPATAASEPATKDNNISNTTTSASTTFTASGLPQVSRIETIQVVAASPQPSNSTSSASPSIANRNSIRASTPEPHIDEEDDSAPSTPTTTITTVSSSFDRHSRALSTFSVATTFSESCSSPPRNARASPQPTDSGITPPRLSPSPSPSPSLSSQARQSDANPRSRRTRSTAVTRSQPGLHAARTVRSATVSGSVPKRERSTTLEVPQREARTLSPTTQNRQSIASNDPSEPEISEQHPPGSTLSKMDNKWINVQEKTFTKWLNTKIQQREVVVKDLVPDLSDGVILIHLLECLSQESIGRYASKPKMRVQKFENCHTALQFVKSRGIQMTNIGAEDVVDGNRKIILGLIWTLILRFTISDINEEGMTAKEGLLLWCQRKTACYDEVEVRDFSASWNDGLAFCALLDIHRPDLIDYDALDKNDHRGNMQLAFDIAHKEIGIPDLLDVDDVCDVAKPDERSLMTYIAYWFHAFSQMEKVENAGRRVEKFVNSMQGAWEMQSAYERRMAALLAQIREQVESWSEAEFEGTYTDAKRQASDFAAHKRGKKRQWVAEKSDLATLLGNIKTKLGTYRLRAYEPPAELSLETMDREWTKLTSAEMKHGQLINETIRDIKNALRKSFADKANDFALALNTMQVAISGLEGDVEDQLLHVRKLSDNLPPLDLFLDKIRLTDEKCQEANIEENDFTTYTYDELTYELGLVKSSVQKKLGFLENQIVARDMTNLTPIQLEEFESVFRHFDRDDSNSLTEIEFSAALASLGLVFSEDEMHDYFLETSRGRDRVTFEQFIRFMVSVTEDQNTAEQVYQSFREVADGKPYVTEMDLRHSLVPDEVIEQLIDIIPPHTGPDMQQDRGQPQYDYISFMEKLMGGDAALQDATNGRSSPTKKMNGN